MELMTQITDVVVYVDRARITRRGTAMLEPGIQTLNVPDLTYWLNPDSVRATAKGTAKARLLGLQVQHTFYEETPAVQVHELEEQIEALQDELKQLVAQEERIKQTQSSLSALGEQTETFALALASGEQTVAEQLAVFDKLRTRIIKFDKDLIKGAKTRRDKGRQLKKLKKELEQWQSIPRREAYTALVEVDVLTPGELDIDLSYVVSGVGWQPLYDLRFMEDDSRAALDISYLAQISQHTGESWEDVTLTLSTARPALASVFPELEPWYIRPLSPRAPALQKTGAPSAVMQAADPVQVVVGSAAEEVEIEPVVAAVESSGATVAYRIPSTVTIPADGSPHKTTLANISLAPDLDYVTAPKLVEAAYRRARVKNDSPYTLLPGQANLFSGDEFIGGTEMELIPPQGEIELFLGVDDRLKVEREFIRRDVDKRVIGGRRRIFLGYEIRFENLISEQIIITAYDQMPVPRHEDVKVKLEFADPKPSAKEDMNILCWDVTLKSKESRALRFVFSVEYPQEMELAGLP